MLIRLNDTDTGKPVLVNRNTICWIETADEDAGALAGSTIYFADEGGNYVKVREDLEEIQKIEMSRCHECGGLVD